MEADMLRRGFALVLGIGMTGVAQGATFYVDAATGDDTRTATDAQTSTTPWKTLSHALAATEIVSGDTVRVAAGTYGTGETFPLPVRNGVSLIGAGANATTITVPETASSAFRGQTSLSTSTTLSNFALAFGGTTPSSSTNGFEFEGSALAMSPTIRSVTVGPRFNSAVRYSLSGSSTLGGRLQDVAFTGVNRGVDVETHATDVTLHVDGASITSSDNGVRVVSTDGNFEFAPVVTGSSITAETATALYVAASSASSIDFSPHITGNSIESDIATGDRGVHGQVFQVATLTGNSELAGNRVIGRRDGIFWWFRSFANTGSGDIDAHSHIANNDVTSAMFGIDAGTDALVAYSGILQYDVSGNRITSGGGYGLYTFAGLYESDVVGDWLVSGNSVDATGTSEDYGFILSLSGATNTRSHDVRMSDNIVKSDADAAAVVYQYGEPPGMLLSGNTIVDNPGVGLLVYATSSSTGFLAPDLGGGELTSSGRNTISGNGGEVATYGDFDVVNLSDDPFAAHDNYWGITDVTAIDARLKDDDEQAGVGAIDIGTPLSTAPLADAEVSADIEILTDLDPEGLSGGDTVRITATLASKGDIGCAIADVELTGGIDGATYLDQSAASPDGFPRYAASGVAPAVALGWVETGKSVTATWDALVEADESCSPVAVLVTASCAPLGEVTTTASFTHPQMTVYEDDDGDGFGVASQEICATNDPPEGLVTKDGDCDDDDATSNPDGTEIADDGIDQDCDGADETTEDTDTDTDTGPGETDCEPPEGGCCKKNEEPNCGWILVPFLPLALRRRARR